MKMNNNSRGWADQSTVHRRNTAGGTGFAHYVIDAQRPSALAGPPRPRWTRRKIGASAGKHAVLIIVGAMFALPLVWMVLTSFKTASQTLTFPVVWWPHPFLWG